MSKHLHVHLILEQRAHLERMVRSGRAPARVQTRARILLLADRNQADRRTDPEIAAALLCGANTAGNIRRRFVHAGLNAALYDRPRPGAKLKITGEVEAQLTVLACSQPPAGKARWTLQMLADKLVELQLVASISDVAVMHRLKKLPPALAGKALLHRQPEREVRGQTGGCARRVPATLRPEPAGRLPGRSP